MLPDVDAKMNIAKLVIGSATTDQIFKKKSDNCISAQAMPFLAYFGSIFQEFQPVKEMGIVLNYCQASRPCTLGGDANSSINTPCAYFSITLLKLD